MKSAFLFGGTADLLAFVQPSALVDYQFRLQGTLTNYGSVGGSLPHTRSGNGTFIGSNGLLQTASANVARFDFDPLSLTRRGLLLELQATELLLQTESINTSPWVLTSATVTNNDSADPTGGTGGDTITITGASNTAYTGQPVSSQSAGTYFFSFFVRSGTSKNVFLDANPGGTGGDVSNRARGWVNTNTGAVTYYQRIGANTISAIPGPPGFWRVFQTVVSANFALVTFRIGGDPNVPQDSWGANVTKDSLSSYIPATTATATRFADSASMTGLPTTNVTLVEKPAGCATLSAGTLTLNPGYTIDRIMVLSGTYSADQVATIRELM
jgi:hypothetical protein